jgi:hypothetical protein
MSRGIPLRGEKERGCPKDSYGEAKKMNKGLSAEKSDTRDDDQRYKAGIPKKIKL